MVVNTYENVSWLPEGSKIDVKVTEEISPEHGKTTAVFVFILDDNDNIILLKHTNEKRGLEIPGGHIENGETPIQALHREVMEEVGCEIENIEQLGLQIIKKEKPEPKYPDLISNQLFFVAKLKSIKDIELAPDSQGIVKMKVEKFQKYLEEKEESYYLDLLNEIVFRNSLFK